MEEDLLNITMKTMEEVEVGRGVVLGAEMGMVGWGPPPPLQVRRVAARARVQSNWAAIDTMFRPMEEGSMFEIRAAVEWFRLFWVRLLGGSHSSRPSHCVVGGTWHSDAIQHDTTARSIGHGPNWTAQINLVRLCMPEEPMM